MIARYGLIAACVAVLGLSGALWWQAGRVDALRAETVRLEGSLAVLERARAQARLAAEVAKANAARERVAEAATAATIERLLTADFGDCADEIIDPALGDLLNGLQDD